MARLARGRYARITSGDVAWRRSGFADPWRPAARPSRPRALEHYPARWNQFDGGKSVFRAGAARSAMQGIGRASQRTRGTDLPHRRPGSFAPWRRCVSLPMPHIAMRHAPSHGAKSSRSNGSIWPDSALAAAETPGLEHFGRADQPRADAGLGRGMARVGHDDVLHSPLPRPGPGAREFVGATGQTTS